VIAMTRNKLSFIRGGVVLVDARRRRQAEVYKPGPITIDDHLGHLIFSWGALRFWASGHVEQAVQS
jgi:hypothetical protein